MHAYRGRVERTSEETIGFSTLLSLGASCSAIDLGKNPSESLESLETEPKWNMKSKRVSPRPLPSLVQQLQQEAIEPSKLHFKPVEPKPPRFPKSEEYRSPRKAQSNSNKPNLLVERSISTPAFTEVKSSIQMLPEQEKDSIVSKRHISSTKSLSLQLPPEENTKALLCNSSKSKLHKKDLNTISIASLDRVSYRHESSKLPTSLFPSTLTSHSNVEQEQVESTSTKFMHAASKSVIAQPEEKYPSLSSSPSLTSLVAHAFGIDLMKSRDEKIPLFNCEAIVGFGKPIPISRIPERFHVYENSPLMVGLTQDKSKKKEKSQLEVIRYAPDKGEWQKKMFPSAEPSSRAQVVVLIHVAEAMMQELHAKRQIDSNSISKAMNKDDTRNLQPLTKSQETVCEKTQDKTDTPKQEHVELHKDNENDSENDVKNGCQEQRRDSLNSPSFLKSDAHAESNTMKKIRHLSESIEAEAQVWDVILSEIVRQVFLHCEERGVLLDSIRIRVMQLIWLANIVIDRVIVQSNQDIHKMKEDLCREYKQMNLESSIKEAKSNLRESSLEERIRELESELSQQKRQVLLDRAVIHTHVSTVDAAVGPGPLGELDARHLWKRAASVYRGIGKGLKKPSSRSTSSRSHSGSATPQKRHFPYPPHKLSRSSTALDFKRRSNTIHTFDTISTFNTKSKEQNLDQEDNLREQSANEEQDVLVKDVHVLKGVKLPPQAQSCSVHVESESEGHRTVGVQTLSWKDILESERRELSERYKSELAQERQKMRERLQEHELSLQLEVIKAKNEANEEKSFGSNAQDVRKRYEQDSDSIAAEEPNMSGSDMSEEQNTESDIENDSGNDDNNDDNDNDNDSDNDHDTNDDSMNESGNETDDETDSECGNKGRSHRKSSRLSHRNINSTANLRTKRANASSKIDTKWDSRRMTKKSIAKHFNVPHLWKKFINTKKSGGSLMPPRQLRQLIFQIYLDKAKGDLLEEREKDTLPNYVTMFMHMKFGTKKLVRMRLSSVVASLREYLLQDRWMYNFARFCSIIDPLPQESMEFFLVCFFKAQTAAITAKTAALATGAKAKDKDKLLLLKQNKALDIMQNIVSRIPSVSVTDTITKLKDRTISVELASTITRSTAIPCIEIESFMDIILESWEKFYSHAYNAIKKTCNRRLSSITPEDLTIELFSSIVNACESAAMEYSTSKKFHKHSNAIRLAARMSRMLGSATPISGMQRQSPNNDVSQRMTGSSSAMSEANEIARRSSTANFSSRRGSDLLSTMRAMMQQSDSQRPSTAFEKQVSSKTNASEINVNSQAKEAEKTDNVEEHAAQPLDASAESIRTRAMSILSSKKSSQLNLLTLTDDLKDLPQAKPTSDVIAVSLKNVIPRETLSQSAPNTVIPQQRDDTIDAQKKDDFIRPQSVQSSIRDVSVSAPVRRISESTIAIMFEKVKGVFEENSELKNLVRCVADLILPHILQCIVPPLYNSVVGATNVASTNTNTANVVNDEDAPRVHFAENVEDK